MDFSQTREAKVHSKEEPPFFRRFGEHAFARFSRFFGIDVEANPNISPFSNLPNSRRSHWGEGITADQMAELCWVTPRIVAQISFAEWTRRGNLRHGEFKGLREDKDSRDIVREVLA